jgi:RNA polymerase sigma factor for flagellar operon FliA
MNAEKLMVRMKTSSARSKADDNTAKILWKRYLKDRTDEDRNALVEHYMPVVRSQARVMAAKMPSQALLDVDDLMIAGTFGLMEAIDHFDPERGKRFESFCTWRVRGAMLDEMRASDWMPRIARLRRRQTRRIADEFQAEHGYRPSEDEIARTIDQDDEEVAKCLKANQAGRIQSLDDVVSSKGDRLLHRIDAVSDHSSADSESGFIKGELRSEVIDVLSCTERLIVSLYYLEHMTLKRIGTTLGLTESRVSQIHTSVLIKLRRGLEAKA